MATPYVVSLEQIAPRPLAVVRATIPLRDVPSRFREFLDQVYAAKRSGAVDLDGQNVFVYRAGPSNSAEIEFGVGARAPFSAVGRVEYSATPGGEVATTTHWGDYGLLGGAPCRGRLVRRAKARTRWSVVGSIRPLEQRPGKTSHGCLPAPPPFE